MFAGNGIITAVGAIRLRRFTLRQGAIQVFAGNRIITAGWAIWLPAFRLNWYFEKKRLTVRQQAQGVIFVMRLTAFRAVKTSGNIIRPRKEPLITIFMKLCGNYLITKIQF